MEILIHAPTSNPANNCLRKEICAGAIASYWLEAGLEPRLKDSSFSQSKDSLRGFFLEEAAGSRISVAEAKAAPV